MRYIITLIALILVSCAATKKPHEEISDQQVVPVDIQDFLKDIALTVNQKNKTKLIQMLDREYRQQQYENLFENNTEDFLNEFFCGQVVGGSELHCLKFDDINKISLVDVNTSGDYYIGQFEVASEQMTIQANLKTTKKVITHYGVYGALGITQVEPEMPRLNKD